MEMTAGRPRADSQEQEPRRSDALPEGAPDGLRKLADGEKLGEGPLGSDERKTSAVDEEIDGLEYLLGPSEALPATVEVLYDTPRGQTTLTFHIHQLDGKRIMELEDEATQGFGAFSETDQSMLNAMLTAEACDKIVSATGREEIPKSPEFIGGAVTPFDAMHARFSKQAGILAGVAGEVRRISGWAPGRVKPAQQVLQDAVSG